LGGVATQNYNKSTLFSANPDMKHAFGYSALNVIIHQKTSTMAFFDEW